MDGKPRQADGTVKSDVLGNRMGFKADKPKSGEHRPSTQWPFQRLWWTDHGVDLGDTVHYGRKLKSAASELKFWLR